MDSVALINGRIFPYLIARDAELLLGGRDPSTYFHIGAYFRHVPADRTHTWRLLDGDGSLFCPKTDFWNATGPVNY